MKGYKAFNKGMVCLGKQYAENTVFEEDETKIGMHFCKNPLDVLEYYPLVDEKGNVPEFAEVEALDEPVTNTNIVYCSKKLKIGRKISFEELVRASVNFEDKKTMVDLKIVDRIWSVDKGARIGSVGNDAAIGSLFDYVRISSSGKHTTISSSGENTWIHSSGDFANISSSGNFSRICSSGDFARIYSSGGEDEINSSGKSVQISATGARVSINSFGDVAQIISSGVGSEISSMGEHAVICCTGINSIAKGEIGSLITLTEWKYDTEKERHIPICVKTEKIDGVKIKEDTYYLLENGEFAERKRIWR